MASLRTKLEDELECSMCLERLKDPRVFPCQHSFCYKCIVDWSKGKRKISCPECKAEVEVGNPPDLSHFKRNPRVNKILECTARTMMMRDYPGGSKNCEIHGERYKYYCKTCDTLTCKDCTLEDHLEHEYCPINETAEDIKKKFKEKFLGVREERENVNEYISQLQKLEKSFRMKNEEVHDEINKHFDNLVKAVELQREKLIARANKLTDSKLQITGKKLDDLQLVQGCLQSTIHDIETKCKTTEDEDEVLIMENYFLKSITYEKQLDQFSLPNDMKFLALTSSEDFRKSVVDSHLVVNDNISVECSTTSLGQKHLKKGEQAVITVICKDSNDCQIRHGGQIIKAEFTGKATVQHVADIDHNNGTHEIIFKPTAPGELMVKFYINGKEAPKCMLKTNVRKDRNIFP